MSLRAQARRCQGVALAVLLVASAQADDAVWAKSAGGTYDWTNGVNWLPGPAFPNGAGQSASLTNDLAGAQTVRLQTAITVGALCLGDAVASGNNYAFTIQSGTGANSLRLRPAFPQGTNFITLAASAGTPAHTISAALDLATDSPLVINLGPSQALTLGGTVATNDCSITVQGGAATLTLNGNLVGAGEVVKNSEGDLVVGASVKDFTGGWTVNGGALLLISGSLRKSGNLSVNGYIYDAGGTARAGGLVTVGSGSAYASDPAQRLPTNRLALSGGWLTVKGQPASTNALGQYLWTNAVVDSVHELHLSEAYGIIQMEYAANSTLGTWLGATALARARGGTLAIRGASMANMTRFVYTNESDFLLGAGGAVGSQTMSIIPWMTAANANASAANPSDWAVYLPGAGIRALNAGEYTSSLTVGDGANVSSGALTALASNVTVNSYKQTSNGTSSIGSNRMFTVSSGALMFMNGSGKFGTPGTNTAGTLNFGTAEGVVWTFPPATNVIGALITGSGGLTKAGLGTLTLAANNTYTGQTTVSASTLIVGDGAVGGRAGYGDVFVAQGARLLIHAVSTNALWDASALRLAHTGAFFGKVELGEGVNETVKHLFLGDVGMPAGTYGSSLSAAAFPDDHYFAGTGVLTVSGNANLMNLGTVIRVQ